MKKNNNYSAKKLAICGMLSALGVIFLYVGSLIEVLDISAAVLASVLCIIAVIEYGGAAPFMIYGVTAILALLLLPNKTPAAFYTVFFGFYPIIKEKLEKLKKPICWLLKELIFNICLAVIVIIGIYLLGLQNNTLINPITVGAAFLVCEAVFILYDIALTRLITFYIIKLRGRIKFK